MDKKAQNIGQIFIYIVAIVIVAVILIFGYKSVKDFNDRANQIELVSFQKNLESSINSITPQYTTKEKKSFQISNDYKEVCFVRNYETEGISAQYNEGTFTDYPLILDSIDNLGIKAIPLKNIFLIKANNEVAGSFDMGKIRFTDNNNVFECFDIQNSKLIIRIEGKGDHVVIS